MLWIALAFVAVLCLAGALLIAEEIVAMGRNVLPDPADSWRRGWGRGLVDC